MINNDIKSTNGRHFMRLKRVIFVVFLAMGLLGAPNCIFAQQNVDSSSGSVLQGSSSAVIHLNSLNPLVKGSSSKSSSSSSSKKIHSGDDSSDNSTDDGSSGWSWIWIIIVIIVVLGIIGILVWYFLLR